MAVAEQPILSQIEEQGFAIVPRVFGQSERRELIEALGPVNGAGQRGMLGVAVVAKWASSARLLDIVRPHLSLEPRPVRAIYFDKSTDANWLVPWHQDLTLACRAQVHVPGFGPWSTKEGTPHVQPPVELLELMLTVRLHLDDCDETNGALRLFPGTHRLGRLSSERIQELRQRHNDLACCACAGDALLMRPLLLHASGRSQGNGHRRVLHIEYAAFSLPEGLQWYEAA